MFARERCGGHYAAPYRVEDYVVIKVRRTGGMNPSPTNKDEIAIKKTLRAGHARPLRCNHRSPKSARISVLASNASVAMRRMRSGVM